MSTFNEAAHPRSEKGQFTETCHPETDPVINPFLEPDDDDEPTLHEIPLPDLPQEWTDASAKSRAEAARYSQAAADSWERSDTDGYLSQWSSDLHAQKMMLQAQIDEKGGMWEFPALIDDTTGKLVPAIRFPSQWGGMTWGLLSEIDPAGSFVGFVNESNARKAQRRADTLRKKGYRIGTVLAPARADLDGGNGTGLSGAVSVRPVVKRVGPRFDPDATIINDGTTVEEDNQ